jgi:hypothetical protein
MILVNGASGKFIGAFGGRKWREPVMAGSDVGLVEWRNGELNTPRKALTWLASQASQSNGYT